MNYQEIKGRAVCGEEWAQKYISTLDERNRAILVERQKGLDARTEIGVGDFVILADDDVRRVTHDWGDAVQTTCRNYGGSFYLSTHGHVSFSGSLDPSIDKTRLEPIAERREGSCWFFSQDMPMAHNGYECKALFRVWKLRG